MLLVLLIWCYSYHGVEDQVRLVPLCQYEDGNPDGSTCNWIDPETRHWYRVDSRNYR